MYTKAYFFTDGDEKAFHGLTDGRTWNGWQCPVFDMDTIKEIQKHVNNGSDYNPLLIDGEKLFIIDCDGKSECEKVSIDGVDYYAIDGWTWNKSEDMNKAIQFYQANKTILESEDCKEAHDYINGTDISNDSYITRCTNMIKASQLSRDDLITILSNNDKNGIYSDADSIREGYPIATKSELLLSIAICEIEL